MSKDLKQYFSIDDYYADTTDFSVIPQKVGKEYRLVFDIYTKLKKNISISNSKLYFNLKTGGNLTMQEFTQGSPSGYNHTTFYLIIPESSLDNDYLNVNSAFWSSSGRQFTLSDNQGSTGVFVSSSWYNDAPTINGKESQNINLGEKNEPFSITYKVDDTDEDDVLTVKEYLDGALQKTRSNALRNTTYSIEITKEKLYTLSQDSYHTISVSVSDGSSETTTTWKFIRVNSAPEITASSDISSDSVFKANSPAITYSLHDAEGDNCYASFKLDSDTILQEKTLVTQDTSLSFSISHSQWILIPNGEHKITLIAEDELGAQDTKDFTFTKAEDTIIVYLKNPVTTTVSAIKALIMPVWVINSASVKVEVCNNANDTSPTWEDITTEVLQMKSHTFINDTKTADDWGGNVRITMIRTNTTGAVELNGFGGSIV